MNIARFFFCGVMVVGTIGRATGAQVDQKVGIVVLSGRPDMVSGGDALVQIASAGSVAPGTLSIKLNNKDVTALFHPDPAGGAVIGLVAGLKDGDNVLEVFSGGAAVGNRAAQITLKNHPITGPIFSGPHQQPFVCQTQSFELPDGSSLGAPLDANCSAKTVVTYLYKSSVASHDSASAPSSGAPDLKPLSDPTKLPADLAWTTTTTGEKVPYVVRVETGTINRAIYQFAVLHDPTGGRQPGPLTPPKAWNRRLMYSFGGGCPGGWFKQGVGVGWRNGVINDDIVGRGYAEASSTLNVAANNCNDVLSAETMMMVKERIIETIGKPLFTFSRGGSGGSYQQTQIGDNYPGLTDGIITSYTFADVQTHIQFLTDGQLLARYYTKDGVFRVGTGGTLNEQQKLAVAGVRFMSNIHSPAVDQFASRVNPKVFCPFELPVRLQYDPVNNPAGARCDIYDHNINIFGRDSHTGWARRPLDNTGVQYGLNTLNAGAITANQFLDLNEYIGGYDNDGNIVATRAIADPLALRAAYQSGLVTSGSGLGKIPIIDVRGYSDGNPAGDNHLKFQSFVLRERLRQANGTFANLVLLVGGMEQFATMQDYATAKMDEWLTSLGKDTTTKSAIDKIVRAKPADLVDSCYPPKGERFKEPQNVSGGECNKMYPTFSSPRMVAGGPISNNILKCQLKPIDFTDYKVTFTDSQKARIKAIFPSGVCDWSKPGVEQQPPGGTWKSF